MNQGVAALKKRGKVAQQLSGNTLKQFGKVKYLLVVFTGDKVQTKKIDKSIDKDNAILHEVYRSVVTYNTAKFLVFKSIFIPHSNAG